MPAPTPQQQQYISDEWKNRWSGVIEAQNQALNWLYTMNTGGVAGTLAYVAAKGSSDSITIALFLFSVGLLCLIGYSASMFYAEQNQFYQLKKDIDAFYKFADGAEGWKDFMRKESSRPMKYRICEILAWIAATAGGLGVVFSTYAILQ